MSRKDKSLDKIKFIRKETLQENSSDFFRKQTFKKLLKLISLKEETSKSLQLGKKLRK